jgi:hypothetical protein
MVSFGGRGKWPKVKSGPNYGKPRKRTLLGTIFKKRSDAGKKRK